MLVRPRSASALAQALARMLGDADWRRRLGEEARRMAVEEYSEPAHLEHWRALLEDLFPDWKKFS
jgi:glycosyltransferase involved in cell wall biosynthesis